MNKISLLVAAAFFLGASSASAQNIVKNPSFEFGASDWTTVNGFYAEMYAEWAHSGNFSMGTGCSSVSCIDTLGAGSFFRQALTTTPGDYYDLSFWTYSLNIPAGEFSVFWDGQRIAMGEAASNSLQQHAFTRLQASSGVTMLEIHGRNQYSFVRFDDFVVAQSVSAVPEPLTLTMLAAGLGVVGLAQRRRAA